MLLRVRLHAIPRDSGKCWTDPSPPEGGKKKKEGSNDSGVTPTVSNLLPPSGLGSNIRAEGVYVGEGLLPMPEKLVAKIWAWKFLNMAEMLARTSKRAQAPPPRNSAEGRK